MNGRIEQVAPRVRRHGLVVRELEGEILIFDRERDMAHCLNATLAAVWKHCDGQTAISDIADLASGELGETVTVSAIFKALDQLQKDNLLEETAAPSTISRRAMLKTSVAAAVAIPVISSLALSTPAVASNLDCVAHGQPCDQTTNCCGGGINNGCCYNGGQGAGVPGVCRVCSSSSVSFCQNECQGQSGDPGYPGAQCCVGTH
jgi:hypothetical protein